MNDENPKIENGTGTATTNEEKPSEVQLLEALETLKKNSVSKEAYADLQTKHNELVKKVIDGVSIEGNDAQSDKRTIEELREDVFKEGQSNLDFVKNALALRSKIMASGGVDPFLPVGKKINSTQEDVEAAQRVADGLQDCIDRSEGDSEIFTMELSRITKDSNLRRTKSTK